MAAVASAPSPPHRCSHPPRRTRPANLLSGHPDRLPRCGGIRRHPLLVFNESGERRAAVGVQERVKEILDRNVPDIRKQHSL